MLCPKCGTPNVTGRERCSRCADPLPFDPEAPYAQPLPPPLPAQGNMSGPLPPPPPGPSRPAGYPGGGTDPVEILIPYRNPLALAAYYTGLFSIIPCLGLILIPVALVCALLGLGKAQQHPESRGKAHAWVGIALALFSGLYHVLVFMFLASGTR